MTLTPDLLFSLANGLALPGWGLLVLAPRWRATKLLVLSGAWPLGLAALYAGCLAAHYLGAARGTGGFGSLAQVAALFHDPWALLAGWVHYLCFDLWVGAWQVRDAQRRGVPHAALVPCLGLTFLVGPVGLLAYCGVRAWGELKNGDTWASGGGNRLGGSTSKPAGEEIISQT